eukprot:8563182-Pyramimonas_sp.AAC.1
MRGQSIFLHKQGRRRRERKHSLQGFPTVAVQGSHRQKERAQPIRPRGTRRGKGGARKGSQGHPGSRHHLDRALRA